MGVYDRDYYRNESGSGGRWSGPQSAYASLIVVNIAAFVVQIMTRGPRDAPGAFTDWLMLKPDAVIHGQVWRLITCAFLHSEDAIWHIVGNMFCLWWAGREVEAIYGAKEFLATYLLATLVSSLAFVGYEYAVHPGHVHSAMGASGAVTAVLVIFALHYPTRTLLLFMIIPVPALLLVVLFILYDVFGALGHRAGEHVGFAAHLGGALFGFLYFRFHWKVLSWWPSRMSMRPRRHFRPKLKVYREPAEEDTKLADPAFDEKDQLEAQLDAVLEKVAKHGKSSLTEREHNILLRASEVYKQRRK